MTPLITFALGITLLAVEAPTQSATPETGRQAFDRKVDGWLNDLPHEDGVVIENRGSRGMSKAIFITLRTGKFQFADTASASRATGQVSPARVARLIARSEPYDGYHFKCRCYDATSVTITIAHRGKTTVLSAYGLDDSAKGAAAVMREWEQVEDRIAEGR
jgi:hypothetical protein